jgi:hypothetical protein
MALFSSLLREKGNNVVDTFAETDQHKVVNSELDHSLRYFFIFFILGGGATIWISHVLSKFNALPEPATMFNVGLVSLVFLIVMVFQAMMIRSAQFNFLLVVLEGALLPFFFYQNFSAWLAIGSGLFIIAWLFGYSRARMMVSNVMKVNFWHYSTLMITTTITALALFLSSLYVGFYYQQGGITFNAYKFVVGSATPGLQYVAPNFSPETKVDSFLNSTVKNYFIKQSEFNQLPATNQQMVVKEASTGVIEQLSAFTKVILKPGESIVSYTFRWVTGLISTAQANGFGSLVVVGMFMLMYFAMKGVMFFVKWPVLVICFLMYLLLQAVGIISIGAEMRQKEVIIVK